MINDGWRSRILKRLLKRRWKKEAEIIDLSGELSSIRTEDHARVGGSYITEREKVGSVLNMKFAELKKVNLRIYEIERGVFTGICPNCEKKRKEKDIYRSPLRDLCITCQRAENSKGR